MFVLTPCLRTHATVAPVAQKCTEYAEGCKPTDRVVQYFWTVLKDFSQAERVLYLRFVWGRSRLPVSRSAFDRLHRVRHSAEVYQYPFVHLRANPACFSAQLSSCLLLASRRCPVPPVPSDLIPGQGQQCG